MMVPYRITIELAIPGQPKTIEVEGQTPGFGHNLPATDELCAAIAANAMLWQSHAMAASIGTLAQWEGMRLALHLPTMGKPS